LNGRKCLLSAALLFSLSGGALPAGACGFDGMLDGSFSASHPKSLSVAFAIRDSIAAGVLDEVAAGPIMTGRSGFWRAVGRLNDLRGLLSEADAAAPQRKPAIAVLLIDSNLWARLVPNAQGFALEAHAAGAQPDDVTIVTNEAILTNALQGAMATDEALDRGRIALEVSAMAARRPRRSRRR
jgi:hypothetical protein